MELKGASFTISNQGGIGGGHFTPIVNKPDGARFSDWVKAR